jgi:hypothetical protein
MVLSLPKDLISRVFGAVAVHVILVLLYACIACGRYEAPEDLIRRTLLDQEMVQAAAAEESKKKRACYLFSKADKMVEWTDVTDHAEDARAKGWQVEEIMFEGSGHCAHLPMHEEQYVAAVRNMWDAACAGTRRESSRL